MQRKKTIAQETLHEIIQRIVEVAQPEKIILLVRLLGKRWSLTVTLTCW